MTYKSKNYLVVSAEGSELYEAVRDSKGMYLGTLIKDLPSGVTVTSMEPKQSFRLNQLGPKVKAIKVKYLDQFEGWVRFDCLQEQD